MTGRRKRARIVLYGIAAVCLLLLLYFIGSELYGNYVAAQWEAAGYPDLRGNHIIWFWIKALAASGTGLLAAGAAMWIDQPDEKRKQSSRKGKNTGKQPWRSCRRETSDGKDRTRSISVYK